MTCFLVPKIGILGHNGKRLHNVAYNIDIIPAQKMTLTKDVDNFDMFFEGDEVIYANGYLKSTVIVVQRDYLIFDTIDEAISKKVELMQKYRDEMIKNATEEIEKTIDRDIKRIKQFNKAVFL